MSPASNTLFGPVPETPREDLLHAYLAFLERRNGTLDASSDYPLREQWLAERNASQVRYQGAVDEELFHRGYARFDPAVAKSPALAALLAFVKMNAGEAYGVEVVSRARYQRPATSDAFDRVERVLSKEETYHTRILLGATRHFGVPEPKGAWKPALSLKLLIGTLAHTPRSLFHPVLLASEVGGVFTFNWVLRRLKDLFPDQPQLREVMEERMMDILVDEIGHVAFNRLAVGPTGMNAARSIAPHVAKATAEMTPELRALGFTKDALRDFDSFGLSQLPEQARAKAFFA